MKKIDKNNFKKINENILLFSLLFLIIIISIGFSSFSENLNINDLTAEVRIQQDIRITGFRLYSSSENVISKEEDYNIKNIFSNLTLPNQNSTVTYRVEITNIGNVEMGIFNITSNINNIKVKTVGEYKLKNKICVDNKCRLGIKKYIDIEVSYKDNEFDKDNINFNMLLTFDFRPFYDITYEGFENDTSSYPQEIIQGDDLSITFNDEIIDALEVYLDNVLLDSSKYSFVNNTLTIKNVTGNIKCRVVNKKIKFTLNSGTNTGTKEIYLIHNKWYKNLDLEEEISKVEVPTKVGYIFLGYKYNEEYAIDKEGNILINSEDIISDNENQEFVAEWIRITATMLTYNNSETGLNCNTVQCALDEINKMIDGKY